MAYTKRYGGGFVDLPSQTTVVDSQFLNAVEDSLLVLDGTDATADGQVLQWINATSKYGPALLLNKNVDSAAAIAWSKLATTGAIHNTDVAGAAAIARSKLDFGSGLVNADIATAAAIAISKLASYPTDGTKFLKGNATWGGIGLFTQPSITVVNNTPTDLLQTISIAGGAISTTRKLRVEIRGDHRNFKGSGGTHKIVIAYGGTTLIDYTTGALTNLTGRGPFEVAFDLYCITDTAHVGIWGHALHPDAATTVMTTGVQGGTERGPGYFGDAVATVGAAVDTTSSQTLTVTLTLSATDSAFDVRARAITGMLVGT